MNTFRSNGKRFVSRRTFMKSVALATAGATMGLHQARAMSRSGNVFPGRIVIWEDRDASSGSTVNQTVVQQMIDDALTNLTGVQNPVSALETLLPGLDVTKKVALKVNCRYSSVPTRWEVVKGITDRLCDTLGGAFPAGNITIFDAGRPGVSLPGCGFTSTNFPGVDITDDPDPDSATLIEVDTGVNVQLSSHIVDCDYFINCPVLKDHEQTDKRWTLGFKNHIGSVNPVTCHTPDPRLLNISSSSHLKDKTKLILTSAIYGIYSGGPGGYPQSWSLFPEENMPNLVMLSTDPVASEHWGIELINQERAAHGLTVYSLPYCENAASDPYNLGIYDFSLHEVITSLPAPSNLSATSNGAGGVALQWSSVAGAAKYRIYRSTDPYFEPDPWGETNLLAETGSCSHTDSEGAGDPDTNYYYVVRAYRACWESANSPQVGAFDFQTGADRH